jgi:transposase
LTDGDGLPVKLAITPGQTHDIQVAAELLRDVEKGQMVLADKAYDADWLREMVSKRGGWANIPPKSNRKSPICFSPWLYKQRNLIERFFNKLKYFRRIATRYDKLGSTFLAMVKLASIRLRLRHNESTA